MASLAYTSPDGAVVFDGLSGGTGAFIEFDTLSGFVGEFEDTRVQVPGVPGAFVDSRDRVVQPMSGSFTLVVRSVEGWVRARMAFSSLRPGRLELSTSAGVVWTPVRLAVSLPSPGHVPSTGARLQVDLVSEVGVWLKSRSSNAPIVTLRNEGDVPVSPTIVWEGDGGVVVLPSGARFELPAVTGEHRLSLAPENSGRVIAPDGTFNKTLTRQVQAVGERVPVGMARTYSTPDGAQLEWNIGVFDPWI